MIEAIARLEWLLRARRELRARHDRFRPLLSFYVMCLVVDCDALYIRVILSSDSIFLPAIPGREGRFLADAMEFLWLQQWLWPVLLAPAFVASAFSADKASKVLPLLFTTPATSVDLILGKFVGR